MSAFKEAARKALPAAVPRVSQDGADVVVRINRPLELAVPDIAAAVMPGVAALMLPKVMGPEHLRLLGELVTAREQALGMEVGHTRFLVLIEGPEALPHLYAIAASPRMAGMSPSTWLVRNLTNWMKMQESQPHWWHSNLKGFDWARPAGQQVTVDR